MKGLQFYIFSALSSKLLSSILFGPLLILLDDLYCLYFQYTDKVSIQKILKLICAFPKENRIIAFKMAHTMAATFVCLPPLIIKYYCLFTELNSVTKILQYSGSMNKAMRESFVAHYWKCDLIECGSFRQWQSLEIKKPLSFIDVSPKKHKESQHNGIMAL